MYFNRDTLNIKVYEIQSNAVFDNYVCIKHV